MKLTIGIIEKFPCWDISLSQIGLSVEKVQSDWKNLIDLYAVVIVTRTGDQQEKENLLHYVSEGGAILIEADNAEWLLGIKTLPAFIKYVEPAEDIIFKGIIPGFIDTRLLIPAKATHLQGNSRKKLVQVIQYGNGHILILPGLLSKSILDTKVRRRNFPTRGPLFPSERVSRRSKQTIREIIQRSLEYLHLVRGIPFVTLWVFPEGAQRLFNLRIDTDLASREKIDALYSLCQKHQIGATWFVETESSRNSIDQFVTMENQEIGLHCYRHHVYHNFIRNEINIKTGKKVLSQHRINPAGYAAPFGLWNVSLAKAIELHGFLYSSEFCLDYDNLPFHPYLGNRFTSVLQIPVHPITTGCLLNAHHSKENIKNYFNDLIKINMEHHLPLFIYDHPSNANLNALNWLLKTIRKRDFRDITLADYARWWAKRMETRWFGNWENNKLTLDLPSVDSSVWLSIQRSSTEWAVVKMKQQIDLTEVEWKKRRLRRKIRIHMSERNALTRKMVFNDILHTYWKFRYR